MTTWNRTKAHAAVRDTLKRINDNWEKGTPVDGERFAAFDDLLVKAIKKRDLERVEFLCERYEKSVNRDIMEQRKKDKQGKLF